MTVSKEITRLEHSALKMTVTIGKDEVRSVYDGLLSEYSRTVQIPGFRKGKVPRDVLVRKFGEDAFRGEALGRIIEKSLAEIIEDEGFPRENRPLPYSTPQVQDEPKLDPEADLSYSVVYDVFPTVAVGQWQGLEVEVPDAAVGDEDLDRELEAIRERNAIVLDRDDGAVAAKGDVVTVNYCELEFGEVVKDSEREDFVFTLGSGYNTFKFDDEILGMKNGETKEFSKTYPEDFENSELAGKTKELRVTVTALKEKKLPDLDDDLAQDVDEKFKTLEDLKASIRNRMNRDLEKRMRDIKVNKILEKVMENTPVELPESMIRLEIDSRWRNLARRFNTTAEDLVKSMEKTGEDADKIMEDWRPGVIKALHSRLIVETLMEDLKVEASDEELEKEFESLARESDSPVEDVKKYYEQENAKEYLREGLKERKLFDRLLSENTIKPGKQEKYLDLVANNG